MLRPFYIADVLEAGCDEAGRGCLAGPVVAAAVILPEGYNDLMINDSKKLSASKRDYLRIRIEKNALAWAVGFADNGEIDTINILKASVLAMHRAISLLSPRPEHIIVDGNYFDSYPGIPHTCLVKGDSLFLSIAAASILAKTHRDEMMTGFHKKFPHYGWNSNKGYPTPVHTAALDQYGPCLYHRKSFRIRH